MEASGTHSVLVMMEDTAQNLELYAALQQDSRYSVRRIGTDLSRAEAAAGEEKPDLILVLDGTERPLFREWISRTSEKGNLPVLILGEGAQPEELPAGDLVQYVRDGADARATARELGVRMSFAISRAALHRKLETVRKKTAPIQRAAGAEKPGRRPNPLIAVGASMGGVEALSRILEALPAEMPGIVVVQHMPGGFTEMYAKRLDQTCRLRVVQAADGQRVEAGTVYIAPGDFHMRLSRDRERGYFLRVTDGERVTGHRPSVNVLFRSVAESAGKDALGIILTGMGDDGAEGLLEMRRAGADTVGQDAETSLVYGMPRVAFELGAVHRQLPLNEIPRYMMEYASR